MKKKAGDRAGRESRGKKGRGDRRKKETERSVKMT
jgi:hypothetical protein